MTSKKKREKVVAEITATYPHQAHALKRKVSGPATNSGQSIRDAIRRSLLPSSTRIS